MPLQLGIGEFIEAIRERVEVSRRQETWRVTAGSFESALAYARKRFEDPVVLSRRDRDRYWPRITLEISTDPARAASAPPVEELARPPIHELPSSLEAFFASQAARR
jgi:hypothetical protein